MHRPCLLAALLLFAASIARAQSVFPVLDRDDHLRRHVALDTGPESLGKTLLRIAHGTGVGVLCAGDMVTQPFVAKVPDEEARELMTEIALTVGGTWVHRKGSYLLIKPTPLAGLLSRGGNMALAVQAANHLAEILAPGQWQTLEQGQPLRFRNLTPVQQGLFAQAFSQEYYRNREAYTEHTFTTYDGGEVWLLPSTEHSASRLGLVVPSVGPDGREPSHPFMLVTLH